MISALGYSENSFELHAPGRLCRGRERWIEPWEFEENPEPVFRGVVSGAQFEDDSARDALRGLQHSGVSLIELVDAVLGGRAAVAFMEDGHPADMPEQAENIEAYTGYRYGGSRQEALVRWTVPVEGAEEIRSLLGEDPQVDRVRGFVVPKGDADPELLRDRLFLLTGMSTLDSPPARFQPAAICEVLELTEVLLLMHRDKHGPAIGVYAVDSVDMASLVAPLAESREALVVPFAIPPMLARWDRALSELRGEWDEDSLGPFPVPAAPEGYSWEGRRRRRSRKRRKDEEGEQPETNAAEESETADHAALEEQSPATGTHVSWADDVLEVSDDPATEDGDSAPPKAADDELVEDGDEDHVEDDSSELDALDALLFTEE